MAGETPSVQEGLSQHPFVEKLMPDPAQPAARTVQYEGLVGKSTRGEGHWRLYFDRDLSDYIEFNEEDVLNSELIAKERSPMELESTKVWLRRDATITRTHSQQVQADAAETASGGYANPSTAGVLPGSLGNPYGGSIPPGAGLQRSVVPNLNSHTTPDYSDTRIGTGRVRESRALAPGVRAKKPPQNPGAT